MSMGMKLGGTIKVGGINRGVRRAFAAYCVWVILMLVAVVVVADMVHGQGQSQMTITAPAPPPVVSVNASYTGGGNGNTPIYYWVVVRYPSGAAIPTGPAVANGTVGLQNLSATQFVTISWTPMSNATGYDVVRSGTNIYPAPCSGSGACAVVLNTAASTVNDTGGAMNDYPPAGLAGVTEATATMTVDNVTESAPYINFKLLSNVYKSALIDSTATVGSVLKLASGGRLINSSSTPVAYPITVPQGGTGNTSFTAFGVIIGNGVGALDVAPVSASTGRALFSGGLGAKPLFRSITNNDLPSQIRTISCQPGLGDGLNAIPAGTYLETTCLNDTGPTVTIIGISCFTDNNGTSTLNATDGAGVGLLTGAITCTNAFAAGVQSATVTIATGDFIKFTFVSDGVSKQTTWVVTELR